MVSHLSVTVIIPTYNRATLLRLAVDSVLAQTRVPEEIIVIDDGSTDETASMLANHTSPVKVISQPNAGRSAARNRGLDAATGDLIAFLDSDDVLTANSIEDRAQVLEANPNIDVVYSDVTVIDAAGNETGLYSEYLPGPRPSGRIFSAVARRNFIPILAAMIRRSSLGMLRFEETLEQSEDFDFWIKLSARCQFSYLDQALGSYRMHEAMTTAIQPRTAAESEVEIQRRVFAMPAFRDLGAKEQAQIYCSHGIKIAMLGQVATAREYFRRAIVAAPTYPISYMLVVASMFGVHWLQFLILKRRQAVGNQAGNKQTK